MITLRATLPCAAPPAWAVLERELFTLLDQAVTPYWDKYTRPDGGLIWRAAGADNWQTRDGADDFYESFYNWPLLYLLGGGDHLLQLSRQAWQGVTTQLSELGMLKKEFDIGYDQFHIGEGQLFFFFLCFADPGNPQYIARAERFAGFYLNEDPDALNYDPEHRIIRAPHNGSGGPRWGYLENEPPAYPWVAGMRRYGLPYLDVPGIEEYDALRDPVLAERMGAVMQERMGRGDVATNLIATSLVTNAFLLTGAQKYRSWIQSYTDAWLERARANGGLLPDNVGLSGEVGEYLSGKWYGGLYGWSWPHGFYNIGAAAFVAAANAFLVSGEEHYLDLPRAQFDRVMDQGVEREVNAEEMSLAHHWVHIFDALGTQHSTFLVPYRYNDHGWFDYQPMTPAYPLGLWQLSMAPADLERVERVRATGHYDWTRSLATRTKEEAGHEAPWFSYLQGENPTYPETILAQAYELVCWRLALIRQDHEDLQQVNIHHWQQLNPVVTEALVQLTLGAPQHCYYGGLLHCRLRYFDAQRRRPGLPANVVALVQRVEAQNTLVQLINLSPSSTQSVIIQAGGFGEHAFTGVRFTGAQENVYPGPLEEATRAPETAVAWYEHSCAGRYLQVDLPPATQLTLDLAMTLHCAEPSYATPWMYEEMGE